MTRFVIIAGVVTAVAAASLTALEANRPREQPTHSREAGWDGGRPQVVKICLPVADSPELILLVHNARGRYCMW